MRKTIQNKIASLIAIGLICVHVLSACAGQSGGTGGGSAGTKAQPGGSTQAGTGETADSTTDASSDKPGDAASSEVPQGTGVVCTNARLPEEKYEGTAEEFVYSDAYADWAEKHGEAVEVSLKKQDGMDTYYSNVASTFLKDAGDTSTVISPFNMYMALSVLAETADTKTLSQILNLLQASDKEELSARVNVFWEANYADTPVMQELLANSLWLSDNMSYEEDTVNRIANDYHASVFKAAMGASKTNEALHDWINTETKDLLKEYADSLNMEPDTVAAIISTLYYKAAWRDAFAKEGTTKQTFHGVKGDTETDMMHRSDRMQYYKGDGFTAVALPLTESGYMIFCLPNEGVTLTDLIGNEDCMKLFRDPLGEKGTDVKVNLTLPKFKVSGQLDMTDALKALGVTDAFEGGKADFSSLTKEEDLVLSKALHACMVETDEDGVTGAAFTALMLNKTSILAPEEEVDFVLDRPFYFAVTSEDHQILFAGTLCDTD